MTKKRIRFLPSFLTSTTSTTVTTASPTPASWRRLYQTLFPGSKKQRNYECTYCTETQPTDAFIPRATLPHPCGLHLSTPPKRVCRSCLENWLSAQLDSKELLEICCPEPECGKPWDPDEVWYLIGKSDQSKFRALREIAKQRVLIPEEVPERWTTDFLLDSGTRFCPWCRWPFIKDGGCDAMVCAHCARFFNVAYALVFEDNEGNRAGPILDDSDAAIF